MKNMDMKLQQLVVDTKRLWKSSSSLQFIEFTFCQECEPATEIQRKKLKHNVTWYVTLTILLACIRGGIHTNNITNLFEQWYIPNNAHTCMCANYPLDCYQIPHPTHAQ